MAKFILTGDLGGTSCRFGIFQDKNGAFHKIDSFWINVADLTSFEHLLSSLKNSSFYQQVEKYDAFVLAAAGPVREGRSCVLTNISWNIEFGKARQVLGIAENYLINDFVAQAYACLSPLSQKASFVLEGEPMTNSPIGVVGAGTGLGNAYIIPLHSSQFFVAPSEAGHVNFSPESKVEFELGEFARAYYKCQYTTMEHLVSGQGLSVIHKFFSGQALQAHEVSDKFGEFPETLELFSRFYGRACRNFALSVLARGGLFITSGIAAKNPIVVEHSEFKKTFLSSPTHAEILAKIPVRLISDQESGLWGGAYYYSHKLD